MHISVTDLEFSGNIGFSLCENSFVNMHNAKKVYVSRLTDI